MKRFLICALAAAVIAVSLACCGVSEAKAGMENIFIAVDYDAYSEIVYHRETKVMYTRSHMRSGYVYTLLVNPDGTPMIWRE